ncbi:serine hydrolase [Lacrimispora sp. JR3]|uniref:serine hydrolase n=1 Tax=Lacrimispora sinapis TaxID=3111456 RepID=UPI003748A592
MTNKSPRLWSLAISFSILASIPAYGTVPVVQPFPGSSGQTSETTAGTVAGPGASLSGQKPAETSAGTQTQEENGTANVSQPQILSEGAVLLDASTGTVLYGKNAETRYYPASITKLMTALIVAEKASLSDTVTYSKTATTNLESGAVTLGLVEGDRLTVEQSLYGLMLKSANEAANGLAEHVSGSISAFCAQMNARAKELGCTNTNFVNPNGLNHSDHYTTPHDMALIARAAFNNDIVRKVASTTSYQIPATKKAGARTVTMGHKMLHPSDSRYYPGVIGGKTGYTSLAGNTLVTCAEKNGVRLVAVVMKSRSTHYSDTKALLDYGFAVKAGATSVSSNSSTGWEKNGTKWYYKKPDGRKASQEWLKVDGADYYFDSDGTMATGWREFPGNVWYYFRSSGALARNYWVKSSGKWYYIGGDGTMLKNAVTPDGYQVDSAGVWIP